MNDYSISWPDLAVAPFDNNDNDRDRDHWGWAVQLSYLTDGYRVLEATLTDYYAAIRDAPRWPFRDLGLTIWSYDKMQALQLSPLSHYRIDVGAQIHGSQ